MAQIQVEDGLLDCPKYGVISELRCSSSCKWFESREDEQVQCKKDETKKTEYPGHLQPSFADLGNETTRRGGMRR